MLFFSIDQCLLHDSHVPLAKFFYQNMSVSIHLFAQTNFRWETFSLLHRFNDLPSWPGNKQDCGSVTGKWGQPMWDVISEVCKEQVYTLRGLS